MTRIRFVKVNGLSAGRDTLLVVAPKRAFARGAIPRSFSGATHDWIVRLAKDCSPGDLGATAATLTGGSPARIVVAVLPDEVSRHDSPARAEMIRRAVAHAAIAGKGRHGIAIVLDESDHALAAGNAVHRALPRFTRKSKAGPEGDVLVALVDRRGRSVELDRGEATVCAATREMARLVDTPPSELDPAALAREARAFLKGVPRVRLTEIAGAALARARLGGIAAVGRAALTPPRMVIAAYAPRRPSKLHVVLVGKGITFDTGGLSLKTGAHMIGMKADMGGAAAVLGAFRSLVAGDCPHRITMLLCMAENAIGPRSYKVDDVITLHSGKTVEINNTDAEGRLLLGDGVSYAARVLKADVVIDAATLTGAQLVATGMLHAGIVSNDEALERLLVRSGRESGDLCHPLPFAPAFFRQEFKSPIADMRNSVKDRNNAPASAAAQFVYSHVEDVKGLRFGHVDLAGPAFPNDRATGFGVALLYRAVMGLTVAAASGR